MERRGSFRAPSATFWSGQVEEEAAGGGSSTASCDGRSTGNGGEGAPVGTGRGGEVCELHEDEAKLMVGSAWTEQLWRCGATVSFELAGVQVDGGNVLGCLGGELEWK